MWALTMLTFFEVIVCMYYMAFYSPSDIESKEPVGFLQYQLDLEPAKK